MRTSFNMPNTQMPVQGPVGVSVLLDFTATDNVIGDLTLEQAGSVIDYVQAIYIDNSLNTKSLSIIFSGMQYTITVKAGRQGVFPVLTANGSFSWRATSVGAAVVVRTIMMNVQQPYFQWDAV